MRRPGARTRTARLARLPAALAALAALVLLAAPPAHANVEEFSTFDVALQSRDDESTLDHFLTRFPRAWTGEWAHATAGLRTTQGCLTSGEWFIDTDFKARAPLGQKAFLGIDYFQSDSDILHTDHLDLSFHFPMGAGAATAMFRPAPDKAAQDFALGWEMGADTSAFQMRAVWTLEDIFNNFWAFRQTVVGNLSEPYSRRPYEPALFIAVRRDHWLAEADAKWLTPSSKRIVDLVRSEATVENELWGAAGHVRAEASLGPMTLEVRGEHRQARTHDLPIAPTEVEDVDWRRQWSGEVALRGRAPDGTSIEARYFYQSRRQRHGLPAVQGELGVLDRMVNLEVLRSFGPRFTARAGGLFDRIGVARFRWDEFDYGTRNESRAYIGLAARFGRVLVSGTEGIELDPEPYEVWFVHDKGFLQLQTTF